MSEQTAISARDRAKGTVYIEVRVEKRLALSQALSGWTDAEIEALLSGDEEAREALTDNMVQDALKEPDDWEAEFLDLRIDQAEHSQEGERREG